MEIGEETPKKVQPLLAAAIAGLLLGGGCDGDDDTSPSECPTTGQGAGDTTSATTGSGGAGGAGGQGGSYVVISDTEDTTMTFAKFSSACMQREGFLQTHATCARTNSCKGMSYNKYDYVLREHTCRAMNTCGGISCVVPADDQGRTGAEIYEDDCAGCHGSADLGFTLYVAPGTDLEQAEADLATKPRELLHSAVALGIAGRNVNGTAFSNMSGYHEKYSRAEITAVIDYVLSLDVRAEEYGILGVNEDIVPP
jgi:hypothetical protein